VKIRVCGPVMSIKVSPAARRIYRWVLLRELSAHVYGSECVSAYVRECRREW
jgi:hypothetical protein